MFGENIRIFCNFFSTLTEQLGIIGKVVAFTHVFGVVRQILSYG